MKKTLTTFFISTVLAFGLVSPVFAATPTFEAYISNKTKETGVTQLREVTVTYSVKNFQNFANQTDGGKDGINVFRAVLEYDENVFERIEINKNAEGAFNGIKNQTAAGRPAIEGIGNWGGLTYNPETRKIVTEVSQGGKYINTQDDVIMVTLKVKATAATGNTTIKLKSIEGADEAKDVYTAQGKDSEVSTTVEVIPASTPIIPDPEDPNHGWIRIMPDIKVSEFRLLKPELTGEIKNHQGTVLANDDYIPTGSSVQHGSMKVDIITVGDVNQDGKASAVDLSQFKAYYVHALERTLSDYQKMACDIKWDKELNTTDNSLLKCILVGILDPRIYEWKGSGTQVCVPVER